MNRVQGDYFETLLYKIFVSIDEQTNVSEVSRVMLHVQSPFLESVPNWFLSPSFQLANVLEIDLGLVKVCTPSPGSRPCN